MADSNLSGSLVAILCRGGWHLAIAIAMVPCIAPAAVFVPHFQFSVLYAIPLTLLACYGQLRALRWLTLVVIALAFITYFLKFWLEPPATGPQFLSFRIVNRSMVAGMLWLLIEGVGDVARGGTLPAGPAVVRRVRSSAPIRSVRCSAC